MNVRDLKLAIASGTEKDDVKSLNRFFDALFSNMKIYTYDTKPDLLFMKDDRFIMQQDLKNEILWCDYDNFWSILEDRYHCTFDEIEEIIQYKVEESFNMGSLKPFITTKKRSFGVEEAFKLGSFTPNMPYFVAK